MLTQGAAGRHAEPPVLDTLLHQVLVVTGPIGAAWCALPFAHLDAGHSAHRWRVEATNGT